MKLFRVSMLILTAATVGAQSGEPKTPPKVLHAIPRCNNGPDEKWTGLALPAKAKAGKPLFDGSWGALAQPSVCRGCTVDDFQSTVNWGDGTSQAGSNNGAGITGGNHTYAKPGEYTISIKNTRAHCVNAGHGYDGILIAPDYTAKVTVAK